MPHENIAGHEDQLVNFLFSYLIDGNRFAG